MADKPHILKPPVTAAPIAKTDFDYQVEHLRKMNPGVKLDVIHAALLNDVDIGDKTLEVQVLQAGINNAQHQGYFQDADKRRTEKIRDAIRDELKGYGITLDRRQEEGLIETASNLLDHRGNHTKGHGPRGDR